MARSPIGRVLALPPARRLTRWCVALAVPICALVVVQWALVAAFVNAVVTRAATPADGVSLLAGALAAWLVRAGLLATRDRLAARASSRVRRDAQAALARTLLRGVRTR